MLGDAVQFEVPRGLCLLYFYTPFKAELLANVLANVVASYRADPRPIVVGYAYVHSYHIDQYSSLPGFEELPTRRNWLDLIRPPRVHLRLFASPEARHCGSGSCGARNHEPRVT